MSKIYRFLNLTAVLFFTTVFFANAVNLGDIYEVNPGVSSCSRGELKESEKQYILNEINKIRKYHGLDLVTYDYSKDDNTQQGALMCAANNNINHTPPNSWHCYTTGGRDGTENSNLYIKWQGGSQNLPDSRESIISWMHDVHSVELGHRLSIINPFVKQVTFGRCDGKPIGQNNVFVSTMALYYSSAYNNNIDEDYIAYPYENYPPDLVDKSYYLSFSAFYDKQKWWNNTNVDISQVQIEVIPEGSGQSLQVSDNGFSTGWGSVGNCLRWKTAGLQNEVKYTVKIKNLIVNGQGKDYTYWFKLTYSGSVEPPPTPALKLPENNSKGLDEDIKLEWNSSLDADYYIVQASKSSNFSSPIINDETGNLYFNLDNLESETKYYWRVKAKNIGGESDWSDVWNFTVKKIIPLPQAPVLLSPADGAKNQNIELNLAWESIGSADKYRIQISDNAHFTSPLADNEVNGNTFSASGLGYRVKYFWRVAGINSGGQGDWSDEWAFTTADENIEPPSAPELAYPNDGDNSIGQEVSLMWNPDPNAASYLLQVSKQSDFSSQIVNSEVTENQYRLKNLEKSTQYFWRVKSKNFKGESNWASAWQFTTRNNFLAPPPPALLSPINKSQNRDLTIVLEWEDVSNADSYRIQISESDDFSGALVADANAQVSEYEVSGLEEGRWYFWRVAGTNSQGGEGPFSPAWEFKTKEGAPTIPALHYPADGQNNVELRPLLTWSSLGEFYIYDVQMSLFKEFTTIHVDESDIGDTTYRPSELEMNTDYYWRVRGIGLGGDGDWSPIYHFKTGNGTEVVELLYGNKEFVMNYPNPGDGRFTFLIRPETAGEIELSLYNLNGEKLDIIYSGRTDKSEFTVNYSNGKLPSGVYYYKLTMPGKAVINKLQIVK